MVESNWLRYFKSFLPAIITFVLLREREGTLQLILKNKVEVSLVAKVPDITVEQNVGREHDSRPLCIKRDVVLHR